MQIRYEYSHQPSIQLFTSNLSHLQTLIPRIWNAKTSIYILLVPLALKFKKNIDSHLANDSHANSRPPIIDTTFSTPNRPAYLKPASEDSVFIGLPFTSSLLVLNLIFTSERQDFDNDSLCRLLALKPEKNIDYHLANDFYAIHRPATIDTSIATPKTPAFQKPVFGSFCIHNPAIYLNKFANDYLCHLVALKLEKNIRSQLANDFIKTDVHLETNAFEQGEDDNEDLRAWWKVLRDVPYFLLGRVCGANSITVHMLFPHLLILARRDRFVLMTEE